MECFYWKYFHILILFRNCFVRLSNGSHLLSEIYIVTRVTNEKEENILLTILIFHRSMRHFPLFIYLRIIIYKFQRYRENTVLRKLPFHPTVCKHMCATTSTRVSMTPTIDVAGRDSLDMKTNRDSFVDEINTLWIMNYIVFERISAEKDGRRWCA